MKHKLVDKENSRLRKINSLLLETVKDMKDRWEIAKPLFNGKPYGTITVDCCIYLCETAISRAEEAT
jgi:hypothetical protein